MLSKNSQDQECDRVLKFFEKHAMILLNKENNSDWLRTC